MRYRSAKSAPGTKRGVGPAAADEPLDRAGEPGRGERDPAREAGVRGIGDGGRSARGEGRGAVPVGNPSRSSGVPHDGQNRCPSAARWAQVGQVAMGAREGASNATTGASRGQFVRRV